MKEESTGLIIGISIGVVIGVVLAISALFCFRYHRKRSQIGNSSSRRAATIPIRANGADSCTILSDSTLGPDSPVRSGRNGMSFWLDGIKKSNMVSASGIPEYSYKYAFLILNYLHMLFFLFFQWANSTFTCLESWDWIMISFSVFSYMDYEMVHYR